MGAAVEIQGTTRSAFLLRAAVAAGTVYGVGTVGPLVRRAFAQDGMGGDVDIVNFALTLEYLETDFYEQAQKLGLSGDLKKLASQFADTEGQHVDALTATVKQLGGMPAKKPTFAFPMKDEKSFLKLAVTLEDTGVAAYNGAGPSIQSNEVLGAAGSIVQVEARHAAAVRLANGQDPAPDAFDRTQSADQVMKAVQPLIKTS
jgi:Ferritin-like domain